MTTTDKNHAADLEYAAEYLRLCSDTFGQLAALLKVVEEKSDELSDMRFEGSSTLSDIHQIVAAAKYIAYEHENNVDCWRADVLRLATPTEKEAA